MNNKEIIISCILLIIAASVFVTSVVSFAQACAAYDKQHDELLAKNSFSSRWATVDEQKEQETFNEKLHMGN